MYVPAQKRCLQHDILNINSHIIFNTSEEEDIVVKAFNSEVSDGVSDIGAKTSRKKDISPAIEAAVVS